MNRLYQAPHGAFEWDTEKAERNRGKHGVTFEQAAEAFADPYGLVSYDTAHSGTEDRFRLLGMTSGTLILLVVFAERGAIRIISARRANRMEVRHYDSNRQNH
ncbi:BrnT family toxin [Selenomonas ruminantium]|uniref:BrnT family toxin n=1 Tax=Selenomonas ruminantium TaxID=971 RepID=UPI0026EA4C0A|nr:BrnT family toxin [Selenomonas ruminantium]